MQPLEMTAMLADYMEAGFLENIIDMFKDDSALFPLLGHLMADERSRVRLGTVALVEEIKGVCLTELVSAIPNIAESLRHPNPTIRADVAYLLGIIGHRDALPYLKSALGDGNLSVRETVNEAIEELRLSDSFNQEDIKQFSP